MLPRRWFGNPVLDRSKVPGSPREGDSPPETERLPRGFCAERRLLKLLSNCAAWEKGLSRNLNLPQSPAQSEYSLSPHKIIGFSSPGPPVLILSPFWAPLTPPMRMRVPSKAWSASNLAPLPPSAVSASATRRGSASEWGLAKDA